MDDDFLAANLTLVLRLTPQGQRVLQGPDSTFGGKDAERAFLGEFGQVWESGFKRQVEDGVTRLLREMEIEATPVCEIRRRYFGSFIVTAGLILVNLASAFVIVEKVSKLPEIAKGLEEFGSRLSRELRDLFDREMITTLGLKAPKRQRQLTDPTVVVDATPTIRAAVAAP